MTKGIPSSRKGFFFMHAENTGIICEDETKLKIKLYVNLKNLDLFVN